MKEDERERNEKNRFTTNKANPARVPSYRIQCLYLRFHGLRMVDKLIVSCQKEREREKERKEKRS